MEYAKSLNLLAAVLGCEASVLTRYNFAAKQEHEDSATEGELLNTRRMKLVVADYGMQREGEGDYEEVSFRIRATQVSFTDGRQMPVSRALDHMLSSEPHAHLNTTVEVALQESGLGMKYLPALQTILQSFKEATGNVPLIISATKEAELGEPAIGMFLQDGNTCIVMQFKE